MLPSPPQRANDGDRGWLEEVAHCRGRSRHSLSAQRSSVSRVRPVVSSMRRSSAGARTRIGKPLSRNTSSMRRLSGSTQQRTSQFRLAGPGGELCHQEGGKSPCRAGYPRPRRRSRRRHRRPARSRHERRSEPGRRRSQRRSPPSAPMLLRPIGGESEVGAAVKKRSCACLQRKALQERRRSARSAGRRRAGERLSRRGGRRRIRRRGLALASRSRCRGGLGGFRARRGGPAREDGSGQGAEPTHELDGGAAGHHPADGTAFVSPSRGDGYLSASSAMMVAAALAIAQDAARRGPSSAPAPAARQHVCGSRRGAARGSLAIRDARPRTLERSSGVLQ